MALIAPETLAKRWDVSPQWVTSLCRSGRIPGAVKNGGRWAIPENAERPADFRTTKTPLTTSDENTPAVLPLPVGISSFLEVRTRYSYVDKTLFVKEVLDSGKKVTLFLRPRRFGKSLNMDMLRCFFEKEEAVNGANIFEGTKIWGEGERYRREKGRYPVVALSFKDVKGRTWQESSGELNRLIADEYRRHPELLASEALMRAERDMYRRISEDDARQDDWPHSLLDLTRFLHKHHKVAPIVLIDEYDTPILEGHLRGYYDEVVSFMRMFLSSGLKDNRSLSFACMTGVMRVAKESIFSGLNNLKVDSVLDQRFSCYFGFTEEEVDSLFSYHGIADKADEAREWYDGYLFGQTEVYNPWSVVNYIDEGGKPQAYWQKTGSNSVIGELVATADEQVLERLQRLMEGEAITALVDTSIAYPQLSTNPDAVFSFLLMAGYLRIVNDDLLPEGDYLCDLRIPNREIALAYAHEIVQAMPVPGTQGAAAAIRRAIIVGDAVKLEDELGAFLYRTASYFDTASEAFYHGMVLGLCATLEGHFSIRSNREAGLGRFDVQLSPKRSALPGIIIEVKAGKASEATARSLAQDALRQIREKDYYADLLANGVTRLVGFGLAFSGKTVCVKSESVDLSEG